MGKPRSRPSRELEEIDAFERVAHRIKTEGIEAAFEALVGVCRDEKAAAPAKSSAGTTLFRAAGFFDATREGGSGKAPSEMSPDELAFALEKLKRQLVDRSDPDDEIEDEVSEPAGQLFD